MRVAVGLACGLAGVAIASAGLVDDVAGDARVRSVLDAHFISCSSSGEVAISFADAEDLIGRSNLLEVVQDEYARQLRPGERPEFVVEAVGSNAWHYVNRSRQASDVVEVARVCRAPAGPVEVVLFTSGERFFGRFRALIEIRLEPAGAQRCRFASRVWAYPESALPRFFARHLGLVDSFFRDKTGEMTDLCVRIVDGVRREHGLQRRSLRDMAANCGLRPRRPPDPIASFMPDARVETQRQARIGARAIFYGPSRFLSRA